MRTRLGWVLAAAIWASLALPATAGAVSLQRDDQAVGNEPYDVSLADLDLDGLPDMITAERNGGTGSGTVTVKRGDLTQGYTAPTTRTVNQDVTALAVGNIDADTDRDVVTSNFFSNSVSLLRGDGTGALAAPVNLPAGSRPNDVALRDLNGDTRNDIVVSNLEGPVSGQGQATVLLADTTGGFNPAVSYPAGTGPDAVAVADVDGDLDQDLVIANTGIPGDTVSVLLNSGTGTFGAPTTFAAGRSPNALAVGDVNGDGHADLAVSNGGGQGTPTVPATPGVSVLLGNGTGGFRAPAFYAAPDPTRDVALGDLDGDDDLDLAYVTAGNRLFIRRGDGTGPFAADTESGTGARASSVAIGEMMPLDDRRDVAATSIDADSVSRYTNIGNPSFSAAPSSVNFGPRPIGAFTEERTVTITNAGQYALTVSSANVVGTADSEYFVNDTNCVPPRRVPAGGSCQLTVRFQAAQAGARSAAIEIFHGPGTTSPTQIPLSGSGMPPDTQAPQTALSGSQALTSDPTPTFRFTSTEAGSTFRCRVSRPGSAPPTLAPCATPYTTARLADGAWVLYVSAVDAANNADATPAQRRFTVDTRPPDSAFSSGPGGLTADATPTFHFVSEPGARFFCAVDGGSFAACSSGAALARMGDGPHQLRVRAVDAAGNADATPAARGFTVDASAPRLAISRRSVRLRRRAVRIRIVCPAAERSGPCSGRLALKTGRRRLGSASYSLAAGKSKRLRVKISRVGRRRVARRRRLRVRASTKASDRAGNVFAASRRLTVRAR